MLVGFCGLLAAVFLGTQVGEGSWALPTLILIGCALVLAYLLFFPKVQIEAPIVGFLLFGYIVGNRGFAQISLGGPSSPLFLGEVGLAICLGLLALRLAVNRERPIPNLQLAWLIFAFLLLGGLRLYLDAVVRVNRAVPITAIRDSATVYYALFFFIAYRLGSRAADRRFLERCVYVGCMALLPVIAVQFFASELFYKLTFRGVPVIFPKGDLLGTFAGFSAFYFFLLDVERGGPRMLARALSLIFFACMLALMSRAAFVGAGAAALLLLAARQPKFLLYQTGTVVAALMILGLLRISNIYGESGFATKFVEEIESIGDVTGRGRYRSDTGAISSSNNQFRLVWWRSIFNDTMDRGPVFGLGFGADLAKEFIRNYYGGRVGDFTVRSPHSIWFTVLGRMGIVGVIVFGVISVLIFRHAWMAARAVAARKAAPASLIHWCAVVNLLGSASFGVVLEGPMGGILFWSLLGLAASQTAAKAAASPALRERPRERVTDRQPQLVES